MSCGYDDWDAAYVLGSLSVAERSEYQEHLTTCPTCARAVQELAGLPGLIAKVSPEVLETQADDAPLPDSLLPSLVREVGRQQRRRTVWTALAAAAAVAAIAGAGAVGFRAADGSTPSAASSIAPARTMQAVGTEPMAAKVSLTGVSWGTRFDLTCSYDEVAGWDDLSKVRYAMWVHTRSGADEQVASWRALPGKTMHLSAASANRVSDIDEVEIRTAAGEPVLTLNG